MPHPIFSVRDFRIVGPYTLKVVFDDTSEQTIDFREVLAGELYGPLNDLRYSTKFGSIRKCKRSCGRTAPTLTRRRSTIGRTTRQQWQPLRRVGSYQVLPLGLRIAGR